MCLSVTLREKKGASARQNPKARHLFCCRRRTTRPPHHTSTCVLTLLAMEAGSTRWWTKLQRGATTSGCRASWSPGRRTRDGRALAGRWWTPPGLSSRQSAKFGMRPCGVASWTLAVLNFTAERCSTICICYLRLSVGCLAVGLYVPW